MTRRGWISLLEPLLAVLACLALICAPLGSTLLATTSTNVVSEEEHERSGQGSSTSGSTPVSTASARHRVARHSLQTERLRYQFRPASRHVPGVATAKPPRPSPCWLRPLRC